MDAQTAIDLAKQLGPVVVLAVLIGWKVGAMLNKIVDRFLAGFDKLAGRVDALGTKMEDHTAADAEVVIAIERLDGKLDGILDQADRFTPVGHHGGSQRPRPYLGSEDDTPQLRPVSGTRAVGRAATPARGVPIGGYSHTPKRPGTRGGGNTGDE